MNCVVTQKFQHGYRYFLHGFCTCVMLCDLCMNINFWPLERSSVQFLLLSCCDPDAPFSQRPVVFGEPSQPVEVTSCIKAACAAEVVHIKAGGPPEMKPCVVAGRPFRLWTSPAPICVTKLQLANIRTLGKHRKWRSPLFLPLSSPAFLIHRCFVFGCIIPAQSAAVIVNQS